MSWWVRISWAFILSAVVQHYVTGNYRISYELALVAYICAAVDRTRLGRLSA